MTTGDNEHGNFTSVNVTNPQSVSQAIPNGTEDSESSGLRYRLPGNRTSPESSDGNFTQIQRSIRAGSPGTIDLSDFQPGATVVNETSQTHPLLQEIQTAIDEADSVIDETDSAIVSDVATDILDAESVIQEASIAVTGEPELVISDAEKLIDKSSAKLVTEMEDDLREAYSYMSSIGIPVPTDEEIAYAEATGDYLGYIGGTAALPANPVGPASSPSYQNANDAQALAGQDAPQGQSQPTVIADPVTRDTPAQPPIATNPAPNPQANPLCNNALINPNLIAQVLPDYPATLQDVVDIQEHSQFVCLKVAWNATPDQRANGAIQTCVDGCYMGYQWGTAATPLWYPPGTTLLINPATGEVCASTFGRNPPGFVTMRLYNDQGCDGIVESPGNFDIPQEPPGAACPPESKPACPTASKPGNLGNLAQQTGKTDCEFLQDVVDGFSAKDINFKSIIGMGTAATSLPGASAIIQAIIGGTAPIIPNLVNRFATWVDELIKAAATTGNCDRTAMVPLAANNAAMAFIQKWTAVVPPQYLELMRQVSNTACQQNMPTGGVANQAWLAGEIDDKEWECWQKLNGNIIDAAKKVAHGERTRANARELDLLYRRRVIDWDDYSKRIRELGVVEDADRIAIHNLNEHWPAQSEIIRLMNRDVFNAETAEKSKLFDGFESNYTEDAEKYGEALGIPKELMKLYWGAHWQLPSYTMAKEFLYRFNTDDSPQNVRFTEDDFRQLLKQDDWAPGHIDRMIAAAYHPIQKRDAILAYMIHASEDDEFVNQLMKVGYAKDDARFMQRYYKKRREIADRKASGYPTMRTAVNAYARCELAESEFQDIVTDISIDEDQTRAAIKAAKVSRKVWERKQAIRTIKRPFLLGLYDVAKATQELADEDVDPACVDDLIKQWQRERMRRDKFFTAGQLCEYRERGIITQDDQLIALVRIGWQPEDAAVIVTDCGMRISEKQAERARREAERLARQLKQQQKEAEKAARLAECGPPPCPANRKQSNRPVGAGQ